MFCSRKPPGSRVTCCQDGLCFVLRREKERASQLAGSARHQHHNLPSPLILPPSIAASLRKRYHPTLQLPNQHHNVQDGAEDERPRGCCFQQNFRGTSTPYRGAKELQWHPRRSWEWSMAPAMALDGLLGCLDSFGHLEDTHPQLPRLSQGQAR